MSNQPITIVTELNRDEYAALSTPYSAARRRIMFVPVLLCILTTLAPTILFAGIMTVSIHSMPPGTAATRLTNVMLAQFWPVYLAVQVMYLLMALIRLWTIFTRGRAQVRLLFPDSHRREIVSTHITAYGIVQSSAGSHIISPWGNITRIDEIPEAFVLQSKNVNYGLWYSWVNLVYVPKGRQGEISRELSIDFLTKYRDAATTSPNYLWHANLVSPNGMQATPESVWPPPPVIQETNVDIGVPLTGTIHLPTLQAKIETAKLSLNYSPVTRIQIAQGGFVAPVILYVDFYRLLSPAQADLGIVVTLALFALAFVFGLYRKPLVVINSQQSLYMNGTRFARFSELQAIIVVDSAATFLFPKARKPAYIMFTLTNGKSRRLPIFGFPSSYETNIAAMILGQFLTESKYPSQF